MTTLTEKDYGFSFYTEQSGSFLVPDKCNGEILVIAAGGGGGGGGASGSKTGPAPSGGATGAGQAGQDGGDTILKTIEGDINFFGYSGGSGGAPHPSPTANRLGNFGQGGENFNGLSLGLGQQNGRGAGVYVGVNDYPSMPSGPFGRFAMTSFFSTKNKSEFEKSGGVGFFLNRETMTYDESVHDESSVARKRSLESYLSRNIRQAEGLNCGTNGSDGGADGFASISAANDISGSAGGGGGPALGIKKKIKVTQGELIDIFIGSGGNGGNGGFSAGTVSGSSYNGGGGGAGAGGFVYLFWNED